MGYIAQLWIEHKILYTWFSSKKTARLENAPEYYWIGWRKRSVLSQKRHPFRYSRPNLVWIELQTIHTRKQHGQRTYRWIYHNFGIFDIFAQISSIFFFITTIAYSLSSNYHSSLAYTIWIGCVCFSTENRFNNQPNIMPYKRSNRSNDSLNFTLKY